MILFRSLKLMEDFTYKVITDRKEEWIKHHNEKQKIAGTQDDEQLSSVQNSDFFYGGKKRLAFLDLLLHQHLIANTLSLDDVREEVDTFMFAVCILNHL